MNGQGRSDLEHVLTMLFNHLELPESYRYKALDGKEEAGGDLVFLLGAGCSRQYGLPSFRELLTFLWEDYFRSPPSKDWSFEVLRDRLDKYWQSQGPEDRKRVLSYYLNRVQGSSCPAYRQLARLAKQKRRYIRAIVNMNFDTLLEDALDALDVPYKVSNSFRVSSRDKLMIYKPHGTIGALDSEDGLPEILDHARKLLDLAKQGAPSADVEERRKDFEYHVKEHIASNQEAAKSGEAARRLIQACHRLFEEMKRGWSAPNSPEALRQEVEEALHALQELRQDPIRARNDLILDIANSDLFSDPLEQQSAQVLLTRHDVVSIGYSGVDAKIAAALRAFTPGEDPRDKKLFVVNSSRPDPRLLLVMAERGSQDLLITGDDASFENFMESLDDNLGRWKAGQEISLPEERTSITRELFMTRAEREALANCLDLAMEIRLSMDVAEQSATSLEKHGYVLFGLCLELARNAGICLSSPEKYILLCAAFLHDLGYYQGYSRRQARKNPGWTLLLNHGEMTKKLLTRMEFFLRRKADPPEAGGSEEKKKNKSIIPSSYRDTDGGHEFFFKVLREVCAGHTRIEPKIPIPDGTLQIREVQAPVRFSLLHAVFAAAEELPEEHPFLPSADPVPARFGEISSAIEDPILEIYLGRKKKEVEYSIERGRVVGKLQAGKTRPSAITHCFLSMAASFVYKFDKVVRGNQGWGMKFVFDPRPHPMDDVEKFRPLVVDALEERFAETLRLVPSGAVAEVTAILDLATIYTQRPLDSNEPRVSRTSRYLESALQMVQSLIDQEGPSPQSLLWHYFRINHHGPRNNLEKLFLKSSDEIILPAWRFFGRNWQDGIESVLMARACLDLGSSWFRGEVVGGLRDLLGEKVTWDHGLAYGHDQCIVCTSRLLYIFSSARRFFPPLDEDWFSNNSNEKRLDETVEGILRFMLAQPADGEIWWGLGTEQGKPSSIRSGDYLAWAARAVMFCLSIDNEIRRKTGKIWLQEECKIDRTLVEVLLRQRWDQLFNAPPEELLSERAEEPHSFIFGHIALACLDLQCQDPGMIRLATGGDLEPLKILNGHLQSLTKEIGKLSQLSKLFLWPALVLADSLEPTEESGAKIVQNCRDCVDSSVWIRKGLDLGSWGFNVKNTQALVTSLQAFWQYVFRSEENRHRFERIFEAQSKLESR